MEKSTVESRSEVESSDAAHASTPPAESVHARVVRLHNGAEVWGPDGELGPVLAIIVDPATRTATGIAVRNGDVPGTGRMVPIGAVISATDARVDTDVTRSRFFSLDRFLVPYRAPAVSESDPPPDVASASDVWLIRPGTFLLGVHENVASGELPISRGLAVFAADQRRIGIVEAWNVHPETGRLVSLVFAPRSLIRRRRLLVDVASVESVAVDGVHLTLDSSDFDHLPSD